MRIYWDAAISMDDGVVLRADVFLPLQVGAYPVLMSYGPYAKGLAFQEGFTQAWSSWQKRTPDVLIGSSNRYQNWEAIHRPGHRLSMGLHLRDVGRRIDRHHRATGCNISPRSSVSRSSIKQFRRRHS
jgi:hypothetical protein